MDDITRASMEQHIMKYDMRLRHLDERLGHVQQHVEQGHANEDISVHLARLKQERDKLAAWLEDLKRKPPENWREEEILKAGAMGIWDAVALQIEKLVERIER